MTKINKNNHLSAIFTLSLALLAALFLSACSSDSTPAPPPPVVTPENPNGLYNGSGTVNGSTSLADVKGLVYNNRFILFDSAENVLYDGTITSVAGNDVTATVNVYKTGLKVTPTPIAATGLTTTASSFSLTLSGTGYGAGSISLTYDMQYETPATNGRFVAVSPNKWFGDVNTVAAAATTLALGTEFGALPDDVTYQFANTTNSIPTRCFYGGTRAVAAPNTINIYDITLSVTEDDTCDHIGTGYTGFAAVLTGADTDDTLWFTATNGTYATSSVLTRQ